MSKTTLSDVLVKKREGMSFEDRAKGFEEEIEILCKEWGVVPWARIVPSPESLTAISCWKDLWEK